MSGVVPQVGGLPVVIYVGVDCRQDPGPSGWGAVLIYGEHVRELHGLELSTTGDRIGLLAVVRALACLKRPVRVRVHANSEYLRRGTTEWLPALRRHGWTAGDTGTITNVELWRELAAALKDHVVEWCLLGVPSEPGYERAMGLASQELIQAGLRLPGSGLDSDASVNDLVDSQGDQQATLAARDSIFESLAEICEGIDLHNPRDALQKLRELVSSNQDHLPFGDHLLPLIDQAYVDAEADPVRDPLSWLRCATTVTNVVRQIDLLCDPQTALAALEWLAGTLVLIRSADSREVLRCLHKLTNHGVDLPPLIAEALLARAAGDSGAILRHVQEIANDPVLARQVFPSRRRARRSDVVTYRVRVDVKGEKPPVWRRLEFASDLHLDDLHKIIEAAFASSGDLYLFASGSGLLHKDAEHYLCPQAAQEGGVGIPDAEVRVDEVLVDVGDKLFYAWYFDHYLYDHDRWEFVIKLEATRTQGQATPQARCTAGRQPDDSDGFTPLDMDQINKELSNLGL